MIDICPVCFWEGDGQDDHDVAVVRGGPNGSLSLEQARRNFLAFGASEERRRAHVRPARPEELSEGKQSLRICARRVLGKSCRTLGARPRA